MAVQKSRVTRSRRGMRRSHDGITKATLSIDSTTGGTHRRHHVGPDGYYKGKLIVSEKVDTSDEDENEAGQA